MVSDWLGREAWTSHSPHSVSLSVGRSPGGLKCISSGEGSGDVSGVCHTCLEEEEKG